VLRQYEWSDPSGGLLARETDAALVRPPFTGTDRLDMLDLVSEQLLAIVAEDNELAAHDDVSSERLAREPWLEADTVTDPVFARYWYFRDRRTNATPVRTSAGTLEEWLAEIAFGRGVNVVPASLAEEYRRPGLAFVPVADAPPTRLVLAWRHDEPPEVATTLAAFAARSLQRAAIARPPPGTAVTRR
jgi:DNA-binding transcriptional LysR family regulator